jgi:uncharacterized protein YlxW (UPF0749 family)
MGDVDYQSLLLSYQRKVAELINQNIVYEAKLNTLSQTIKDLTEKIQSLESSQKEEFE